MSETIKETPVRTKASKIPKRKNATDAPKPEESKGMLDRTYPNLPVQMNAVKSWSDMEYAQKVRANPNGDYRKDDTPNDPPDTGPTCAPL